MRDWSHSLGGGRRWWRQRALDNHTSKPLSPQRQSVWTLIQACSALLLLDQFWNMDHFNRPKSQTNHIESIQKRRCVYWVFVKLLLLLLLFFNPW